MFHSDSCESACRARVEGYPEGIHCFTAIAVNLPAGQGLRGTRRVYIREGQVWIMGNLIDMHCDTISRLMNKPGESLRDNSLCVDIKGMKEAGTLVQFFACFVNVQALSAKPAAAVRKGEITKEAWDRGYEEVLAMAARIDKEQTEELKPILSFEDILDNEREGIISSVKTVEEGGILNGNLGRLEQLYNRGIRLVTLTWNYPNCLGFPNSRERSDMQKGLTDLGIQAVKCMNQLGIIVDVSHLSDGGFWDCIQYSDMPICASHSNARELCPHPRNLSDEMLISLGNKGGVAGLNFYPPFLRAEKGAKIQDIARHAAYIIKVAGEETPAIGTDFDGFDYKEGDGWIRHVGDIGMVWEEMRKQGITERQLDKVMEGNARRILKEVL